MSDARDAYDKAIKRFGEIDAAYNEKTEFLAQAVANLIDRPDDMFLVIPNMEGQMPIITGNNANAIDGRLWPDASELKRLLESRTQACTAIRNSWVNMPVEQRRNTIQHRYAG